MRNVPVLTLLLANVHVSHSCRVVDQILLCQEIPTAFSPGHTSLFLGLKDVGGINSTVLRSDNLTSVTKLWIDNAGVTGISDEAFGSFRSLLSLSLEQNLLTEMNPAWLSRPSILSELSLRGNLIEVVEESMLKGLTGLSTLNLSRNRITTIHPNSFGLHTNLSDLDLSENRMTRVSTRVFMPLTSTRIRLDGNPWDCSCEAWDFINYLRELRSMSLLQRETEVTCATPPSLRGRAVWNVSECVTSPTPGPTSLTPTVHPDLTEAPLQVSTSAVAKETPSVAPSEPNASISPATALTTETKTSSFTSSDPAMRTPAGRPETVVTVPTPPLPHSNIIPTLIAVIVVLCVLLFVVCFLAVQHRRKRNSKTVMPRHQKEERNEAKEDGRLSHTPPALADDKHAGIEQWDSETGHRRPFTGGRAKSADAVLSTCPFGVSGKDDADSQAETETSSSDRENPSEGKKEPGNETEASGGFETENICEASYVIQDSETAPYLSIGTIQNTDDFNKQSTGSQGQRSEAAKTMGRISTWPPTAALWQARCTMKQQEEERADGFTVWTPEETIKFPGEGESDLSKAKNHFSSDKRGVEAGETEEETAQRPADLKTTEPKNKTSESLSGHVVGCEPSLNGPGNQTDLAGDEQLREEGIQDSASVRPTSEPQKLNLEQVRQNQTLTPVENPAHKINTKGGNKGELRNEPTESRGQRSRGSKAPSGGASPDDEALLCGNEYAFLDLLHEVVQNNGRWTRERWKQSHVNKQRSSQQGQ